MAGSSTDKRVPSKNVSASSRRSTGVGGGTASAKRQASSTGDSLPSRRSTGGGASEVSLVHQSEGDSSDNCQSPLGGRVVAGEESDGAVEAGQPASKNNGALPSSSSAERSACSVTGKRRVPGGDGPTAPSSGSGGCETPPTQGSGDDSENVEPLPGCEATGEQEGAVVVEPRLDNTGSGGTGSSASSERRSDGVGFGPKSAYESPLKRVKRAINGTNKRVIDTVDDLKAFIEREDPQGRGIPTSVVATIALRMRLVWTSFEKCSNGVTVARLHLVDNLVRDSVPEMHKVFKNDYAGNRSIVDSELLTASLYGVDESNVDLPGDGAILLVSRMWSLKLFAKQSCQLSTSLSSMTVEAYTY